MFLKVLIVVNLHFCFMSMKSSWKQNSLSYKRGRKIELSQDCKKYVHIQQT